MQISISNICLTRGHSRILNDVTFTIAPRQVTVLKGANGSGKTTLLNVLGGYIRPDAGTISYKQEDSCLTFCFEKNGLLSGLLSTTTRFNARRLAAFGIVKTWQDIRLFPDLSVTDNIVLAASKKAWSSTRGTPHFFERSNLGNQPNFCSTESDFSGRISQILHAVNLSNLKNKIAKNLSMGEAQRVAILRACVMGAKVLLLDEPLSGLDSRGAGEVTDLIAKVSRDFGVTVFVSEHETNAYFLDSVEAQLVRLGQFHRSRPQKLKAPEAENLLIKALKKRFPDRRCKVDFLQGNASLSILNFTRRDRQLTPLLDIRGLVIRRGHDMIVACRPQAGEGGEGCLPPLGLNLKVARGSFHLLQAPNGWGKTTILGAIMRQLPIEQGEVIFDGLDLGKWSVDPWRKPPNMHYLSASSKGFSMLTVEEYMLLCGSAYVPEPLEHLKKQPLKRLSGGEHRLVRLLALFMGERTGLFLLDEPTLGLDPRSIDIVASFIISTLEKGNTILAVEPRRPGMH